MDPERRREAYKLNATTYRSANPCVHGHGYRRYTKNGRCVQCAKEAVEQWRRGLPTKITVRLPDGVSRAEAVAALLALGFKEV